MCYHAGHHFTMSYEETQQALGKDVGLAPGTSLGRNKILKQSTGKKKRENLLAWSLLFPVPP